MNTSVIKEPVVKRLAETYQQLYIAPGEDAGEKYAEVVKKGTKIKDGSLEHFLTDERDSLEYEDTPAGKACIITLFNRADFITFLQIMGNRCMPVPIPETQGASILDGVINWEKIRDHRDEFISAELRKGNTHPDWAGEFKRFTSEKDNYTDSLIVLSIGPYSGISAGQVGIPAGKWLEKSYNIRRYHECTHFICRRKYPDKKDAIWDELVADAVGIYAAFDRFDPKMEELFLGIKDGRYEGGRLENYIEAETGR